MISVAITPVDVFPDEATYIRSIIDNGWSRVHLRHPMSSPDDMRRLIDSLPACYHTHLWLHDHHELAKEYDLGGLQLNRRHPFPPDGYEGELSMSCHSIEEVKSKRDSRVTTVTLSPIFDSISKKGYQRAFTHIQLAQLSSGDHVIALGGVTPERVPELQQYQFAGFAVLGYLFQSASFSDFNDRLSKFKQYICYNS